MSKFQILCVTMNQHDFSKVKEMNIHSDVVFANQADTTSYEEKQFDGFTAKMITTATRGVGINRNLALTYADAEYCLFADDDVCYVDNVEEIVLSEFRAHPDADVFIFNFSGDDAVRRQVHYQKTARYRSRRMPWGGFRIAVRLSAVRKANLWFTTLFGGGCKFPSGEDSMWLAEARRRGLRFYVSGQTIGTVSFDDSTWFSGYDQKFYFGKGAFLQAAFPSTCWLRMLHIAWRTKKNSELSFRERLRWMQIGRRGYRALKGYNAFAGEGSN